MRPSIAVATLLTAALIAIPTAASAKGAMAASVGNTLIVDYGEEGKLTFKLKADGSFTMMPPTGAPISGHWLADDNYMCTITTKPVPKPGNADRCERILYPNKKVGETWKQVDSYGDPVTITIQRGQ
ncbi:hypothetical protein [Sphingomonas glacialis]|uniref:Uncharacterized protein n=1 Tax=Sphingomonas glacialis TaxID=658225 RepID=A0A502FAN0_9SPHN|nr:hypothetical protein [Sphingomonas glacialis]TPG46393.1 hypothetical protein EAH76_23560 [Sphingomonas glacialis]